MRGGGGRKGIERGRVRGRKGRGKLGRGRKEDKGEEKGAKKVEREGGRKERGKRT